MEQSPDAMKAARQPVGAGSSPLVAQLIALGVIALGVVLIEEALARTETISQPSWTNQVLEAFDGVTSDTLWVVVVAVLLVLVGLVLLLAALKRRPRKAVALAARTGVYLRTGGLARIAESAVEGAESVTETSVSAKRRRLLVTATTVATRDRNAQITQDVHDRLAPTLEALEKPPRVKVTVKNEGL